MEGINNSRLFVRFIDFKKILPSYSVRFTIIRRRNNVIALSCDPLFSPRCCKFEFNMKTQFGEQAGVIFSEITSPGGLYQGFFWGKFLRFRLKWII